MTKVPSVLLEKIEALQANAFDGFFRNTLEGAQCALDDRDNPLRLNFFSLAMRILFDHTMGTMAPNDMVVQCAWFTPERDRNKPTRKQRVMFAIQGGLSDAFVIRTLNVNPSPFRKRLLKTVNELSKHVHGRESTIVLNPAEQDNEAEATIEAMASYFDAVHDCRDAILDPIRQALDDEAIDALLSETILEVDAIATHHSIEEVYVDRVTVDFIGPHFITYRATGTVSVVLQWGSNSDLRRGDGAELGQAFPFRCDITTSLDDPWNLGLAETDFSVDTTEWSENMEPDQWDQ